MFQSDWIKEISESYISNVQNPSPEKVNEEVLTEENLRTIHLSVIVESIETTFDVELNEEQIQQINEWVGAAIAGGLGIWGLLRGTQLAARILGPKLVKSGLDKAGREAMRQELMKKAKLAMDPKMAETLRARGIEPVTRSSVKLPPRTKTQELKISAGKALQKYGKWGTRQKGAAKEAGKGAKTTPKTGVARKAGGTSVAATALGAAALLGGAGQSGTSAAKQTLDANGAVDTDYPTTKWTSKPTGAKKSTLRRSEK